MMRHRVKGRAIIPAIIVWTALIGEVAIAATLTWAQGELAQESSGNWSAKSTSSSAIGGYQMTQGALTAQRAAIATFALNSALCFFLMFVTVTPRPNASLGAGFYLSHLSSFRGPPQRS